MAVEAQLFSDHNQNYNMGLPNLPMFGSQDWVLMSGSSVFGIDENRALCSAIEEQRERPLVISQQQQQQQQHLDHSFLQSQEIMADADHHLLSSSVVSSSASPTLPSRRSTMMGSQQSFLASELERQRLEMDCFLHFQNEKLKAVLNEESRRREFLLLQRYESQMKATLNQKDEVLNRATNRTKELQNYLLMAEREAKEWEKKAIENEAMIIDLNNKLNQARERNHEDAESVCVCGGGGGGDETEGEREQRMACKVCHVRSSCVLLLPCRHLCCCRPCEGLLGFCPVCGTVKNGSLEVFFGLN